MKFSVGDKACAYQGVYKHIGKVIEISPEGILTLELSLGDRFNKAYFHHKQCRRIKNSKLVKVERWVNVYPDRFSSLFDTKEEAEKMASAHKIDTAKLIVKYRIKE